VRRRVLRLLLVQKASTFPSGGSPSGSASSTLAKRFGSLLVGKEDDIPLTSTYLGLCGPALESFADHSFITQRSIYCKLYILYGARNRCSFFHYIARDTKLGDIGHRSYFLLKQNSFLSQTMDLQRVSISAYTLSRGDSSPIIPVLGPFSNFPRKDCLNKLVYLRHVGGIDRVLVAVHGLVSKIESGDDQVGKRNLEYQRARFSSHAQ
jgi:hypothetical protein